MRGMGGYTNGGSTHELKVEILVEQLVDLMSCKLGVDDGWMVWMDRGRG